MRYSTALCCAILAFCFSFFAVIAGESPAPTSAPTPVPATHPAPRLFGKGHPFQLEDLPDGELKTKLRKLDSGARKAALEHLHKKSFSTEDIHAMRADDAGSLYYTCELSKDAVAFVRAKSVVHTSSQIARGNVPISSLPALHSRQGSAHTVYLDFKGATVTNTGWNQGFGVLSFQTRPFDLDGDETTFNDAEQTFIQHVWERVAEDYSPFDIDVTTEEPPAFGPNIGHVLFTRNKDKNGNTCPFAGNIGGVAYLDVYGLANYSFFTPAWVYYENLPAYGSPPPIPQPFEDLCAEAASHEMGHNLGLSHDGTSLSAYYNGHGTGATSWGPIMGTGFGRNVTQWTHGEYFDANNTEDQLAIIAGKINYRPADHGSTDATASTFAVTGGTTIVSSDPKNRGVIEQTSNVDVFTFATQAGPVTFNINPFRSSVDTRGGNVDLHAELYNSVGTLVQTSSIAGDTNAVISTTLAAGVYYLHVSNEGDGTPLSNPPSGYTNYGSVGQYFIDGTLTPDLTAPTAVETLSNVTTYGATTQTFTVTYSDNFAIDVGTLSNTNVRVTSPAGFDVPATFVSVSNASHGTPRVATYSFTPPGGFWDSADNNTYTATVQAGQVRDISGNAVATTSQTFTVNVPAFALAGVTGPANGSYRAGTNLDFQVTYTQPVVVTGAPSIALTIGASPVNATYVSGSGTATLTFRYVVQPGDTDTDGIASASPIILNGGSIKNSSNTNAALTFTPPNTTAVLVDTTAPNITGVTGPANATYGVNRNLDFTANFNEPVFVTGGTPTIALTIGATARSANYISGGGSAALLFRYTVQAGESDSDGIVSTSPIQLNGALIRDLAGNNSALTFTPPVTTSVLVNTVSPAILSVTGPADGEYLLNQNLDFIVQYDHVVYVANGTPTMSLTIGASPVTATYISGNGTALLTFRHTVVIGEVDTDGIDCASPLVLNGATIQDVAGNNGGLTFTPPLLTSVTVNAGFSSTIIVTNANDSGAGSLRKALSDVTANGVITFDPTFFNTSRTINLASSLQPNKSLTINGPGANLLTVAGNNTNYPVFELLNGDITLIGMTLTGGHDNYSLNFAGGVTTRAAATVNSVTILDCNITGNVGKFGGGVSVVSNFLTIRRCTVSNNQAVNTGFSNAGGGINYQGGTMLLENCTISGNSNDSASDSAGGVCTFSGTTTIVNCTITNNSNLNDSTSTGGLIALQNNTYVFNSIIAGNTNGGSATSKTADICIPDPIFGGTGKIYSDGYNLIGNIGVYTLGGTVGPTYFVNGVSGDQVGTPGAILDPGLSPLGNYGGPTPTHLITPSSLAYNKGSNTSFTGTMGPALVAPLNDQRGLVRPRGAAADIGAIEAQVVVSPATIPAGQSGTLYPTVTFSATGGTPAYALVFSGSLPSGMTCDGTTLAGTPTAVGSFPFTITATDSTSLVGTANFVLTVGSTPGIDLVPALSHTGTFKQGQSGVHYSVSVANTGALASSGTITATMSIPAGLTPTAFTGTGWVQTSLAPPTATFSGTIAAAGTDTNLMLTANIASNAAATLIPTVTISGGGETNTTNDTASDSTTVLPDQAPQISGTLPNQALNDTATLAPFTPVTIFYFDSAQSLTTSVTVSATSHGDFTPGSVTAAGFTNAGGGSYTFNGTAAALTAAIRQLVFAPIPTRVSPGTTEATSFTISVNDGISPAVTDSTTSVNSLSINNAPTISGAVANQALNDTQTLATFTGVTVADVDPQTLTVSVSLDLAAKGKFTAQSLTASGFADSGNGVYTFSGTPAAATTAIRLLVFAPTPNRVAPGSTEITTLSVAANDGVAPAVLNSITTVVSTSLNDGPAILGMNGGLQINDTQTIPPFAIAILRDLDVPAQTLAVSVTLDDPAKGAFTPASLTASGFTDAGAGRYTFNGATTIATNAIRQLVFAAAPRHLPPGQSETTTMTVTLSDGIAPTVTDKVTTVTVTFIPPPVVVVTSPASATPPNPGLGQTVQFAVGVTGSGTLTYSWDFGDGSPTSAQASPTHAYQTEGAYTATVTVSDTFGNSATSTVTVTVSAPLVGTGPDSDGDGVSDGIETTLGTSPTDPLSTPYSGPVLPLTVLKAGIKLNFASVSADGLSASGTLHIPKGYSPLKNQVALVVGSVVRSWTLDAKGKGKTRDSSFKLMIKTKKKVVLEQDAKFSIMFKKVALALTLDGSGLKNADARKLPVNVTFNLILNKSLYRKAQDLVYTAKKGKTGMAKSLKVIIKK